MPAPISLSNFFVATSMRGKTTVIFIAKMKINSVLATMFSSFSGSRWIRWVDNSWARGCGGLLEYLAPFTYVTCAPTLDMEAFLLVRVSGSAFSRRKFALTFVLEFISLGCQVFCSPLQHSSNFKKKTLKPSQSD